MNGPTGPAAERESRLDRLFRLLSSRTRRELLRILDHRHHPMSIRRLAADLSETGSDEATTRLELYHRHLPALDAAGLVDWNREDETVTTAPRSGVSLDETEVIAGDVTVLITERSGADIEISSNGETKR